MRPEAYNFFDENKKYLCPVCNNEMEFFLIEEIDETTGKVISRQDFRPEMDVEKAFQKLQESYKTITSVVECPYCHSKNTSKISTFSKVMNIQLGGMYGAIKANKNWQCHDCGSEF